MINDELSEDFLAALKKCSEGLEEQMRKQEELEKSDPPGRERIEYEGIIWVPTVKKVWVKGE